MLRVLVSYGVDIGIHRAYRAMRGCWGLLESIPELVPVCWFLSVSPFARVPRVPVVTNKFAECRSA